MSRELLPIDSELPKVLEALESDGCAVVRASPGAGKTTRIPPAVERALGPAKGQIWMIEPRRMAARTAARRLAREHGSTVGHYAGYRVRFDHKVTRDTRVVVATQGILLRHLQSNPLLEGVGAVIFDEFHERQLDVDLALAMVSQVRKTLREDLKIIVMSATLDPMPISEWLGSCPVIDCPGRQYPVEVKYSPIPHRHRDDEHVVQAIEKTLSRSTGDLLVFLPGVGEIFGLQRALTSLAKRESLAVLPLYGDLDPLAQDQVLQPNHQRKVVLSTNVAETSVTIEGVTTVIDTGQARIMQFDPQLGLDRLELVPISKASSDQRAGRAGRMEPGVCIRLWNQSSHRHRSDQEKPEIQRVDLSSSVLQLHCWGESDVEHFPWFEKPQAGSLKHAVELLERLQALDQGRLTSLGRRMNDLPVHPRLARMLIEGQRRGVGKRIAILAALLSERDPFRAKRNHQPPTSRGSRGVLTTRVNHRSDSDVLDRLIALEKFREGGVIQHNVGTLQAGTAYHVLKVAKELERTLEEVAADMAVDGSDSDQEVLKCLLAAFPDRLARRREVGANKGMMVGGKGVRLAPSSAVHDSELFLCVDVDAGKTDASVRLASGIEREWLDTNRVQEITDLFFHPTRKEVQARRRVYWEDLALSEWPVNVPDNSESADLLYRNATKAWVQVFPKKDQRLMSLVTRIQCLRHWLPDEPLPNFNVEGLQEVMRDLCSHCRSFDQLKKADWLGAVRGRLSYSQMQFVEGEAPDEWQSPGGRRFKIQYEEGSPPILAARIQDLFGLRETPTIARNQVSMLLHMLAPNMRPQQVTDDLESFWKNTYPVIRKELRGRYPKHEWPEDPLRI